MAGWRGILIALTWGGPVELTDERERHIRGRHPEILGRPGLIAETLGEPDLVRRDAGDPDARLLSRWYDDLRHGRHVVVVVVSEARHWIVTAFLAADIPEQDIEWERS